MRLSCFSHLVNYILDFEDALIAIISKFSSITSWQIDEEEVETVAHFIFLDSKITVNSGGRDEIQRHLLLGRKVMTNLD